MNKAELVEALSAHYDGNKTQAAKALNAVVHTIMENTATEDKVSITGFGVFERVARPERVVRNPRTGERKTAEATTVPRFRAGSELKAYVAGSKSAIAGDESDTGDGPVKRSRVKAPTKKA